ncbi:MAG: exodeoxyribonuclease VII large subunit [Dysgonamonadaceae bacterium]|jgi:exodeoxyribonuclease VII large subunit|nr:exodeoxyribonuclease VII large subunit [Dysgonamonadaceae bacterium]
MTAEFISLSQLNSLISNEIRNIFEEPCWVMAETSDVRENASGHCYLEFIEKDPISNATIAKSRAYIWAKTWMAIKPYFEMQTGRKFASGLKILARVYVEFHPLYGFGLNVCDIDPNYTLGDLQAQRMKILKQLEDEGVLNLNKELEMPETANRIAVISSPTAAGYEDFLRHLNENAGGFVFYTRLFPAVMQGEQTSQSIIAALDKIFIHRDLFDAVVIIRGGGSTSDLASFDDYELAANCAQFPLPIITGIGHERDDTVLDFVAHFRAKTPTAAADFLIERLEETAALLLDCQNDIAEGSRRILETASAALFTMTSRLPLQAGYLIENRQTEIANFRQKIESAVSRFLGNKQLIINEKEAFFRLSSPDYLLARGYSITTKNGKTVRSARELREGDIIETRLADGKTESRVIA